MVVSSKNTSVEVVFESANKTKVYMLKDLTTISAFRGLAAEKAKRFASMNLTKDELNKVLTMAIDAVNKKQDLVTAISALHELKFRSEMICEENSLMDLACIYLMITGEDIEHPTEEFNKKKIELANSQPDLKAFFLRGALQLADNFSKKPGADLLVYLEETKTMTQRLHRFTQ
jgi:hypothetical protein